MNQESSNPLELPSKLDTKLDIENLPREVRMLIHLAFENKIFDMVEQNHEHGEHESLCALFHKVK